MQKENPVIKNYIFSPETIILSEKSTHKTYINKKIELILAFIQLKQIKLNK